MPDDADHGRVEGGGVYDEGTVITIKAIESNMLYNFKEWSDGVKTKSRTLTVTEDKTLIAKFYYNDGNVLP